MGKKVVAKILVVLMLAMTIVTNVPGNTAKAAWNAYYFGNLTYVSQWGVSSRSVTDGALKVTFNSKYGEVKYSLPNAISLSAIESITIGAGTGGQETAFKFYDAGGKELFVKYNANNWGYVTEFQYVYGDDLQCKDYDKLRMFYRGGDGRYRERKHIERSIGLHIWKSWKCSKSFGFEKREYA